MQPQRVLLKKPQICQLFGLLLSKLLKPRSLKNIPTRRNGFSSRRIRESFTMLNVASNCQENKFNLVYLFHCPPRYFFKWPIPGIFLFISFFSNIKIFTTNVCEKCRSCIWCQELNPQPSELESEPLDHGSRPYQDQC